MDIDEVVATAAKEIDNSALISGLSNIEELKACVLDLLPLQQQDTKSLTIQGTLSKFKSAFDFALLDKFLEAYNNKTNETLKLAVSKKLAAKSGYKLNKVSPHWCHHDTRYCETEDSVHVLSEKPAKRFKNTCCPFKMMVKTVKTDVAHSFSIILE